jgi:hypothetical protein
MFVRAVAYKPDFEPTDIDTHTYIFPSDVVTQSVMSPTIVNHATWGPLLQDSLAAIPTISLVLPDSISLTEQETSIEMIFSDGTKGFQADVGVEHFGGHSLGSPKKNMRISFKKIYGPGRLSYDLFEGTKHEDSATDEFDQFILRTGSHDTFFWTHPSGMRGTHVRGRWAFDRQLEMNQPAPRGRYVHVYVNGTYWGQHHLMERPNDEFMASYFGGDAEDYDAINAGQPIDGDLGEWTSMLGSISDYEELQKHMDVENYADYMLLQFFAGNDWDWNHSQNWMASTEDDEGTDTGEGFKFFAWDADVILRSGPNSNVISRGGPGNIWNVSGGPRQHEEFRMMLADRAQKYFFNGGMFTDERFRSDFDALADQIRQSIIAETARWGAPSGYTPDVWQNEIEKVKDMIAPADGPSRADTVIQQMRVAGVFPQTDAPMFNQHGGGVTPLFELDITAPEGTTTHPIYYTLDGSDPMSPGALVYDGTPFALDDNTQVKTRAKNGDEWSALNQANFAFVKLTVRITEVNYNPFDPTASELAQQDPLDDPFDDDDFEFIEMYNTGDESVNLVNFTLAGDVSLTLPNYVVEPDQYALLVRNEEAFLARYGNALQDVVVGEYSSKLSDGSGEIIVHDSIGTLIHEFTYDDSGDWPGRADGKGSTLEVLDTSGDYNDSENWRSSGEFNGSPGAEGQGLDNRVVINELLTHTDPPQTDAIELFNTTNAPIDVGGWYLSDNNNQYNKFRIPDGTVIAARGYLAFDENDFNVSVGVDPNDFALDGAHGDDVYLLSGDASGNVLDFIDHVEVDGALNGISYGRWPDETSRLRPLQWNSFGRENAYPVMPDLMISEIHYNPAHATPRAWTKQAGNWQLTDGHLESSGDPTGTVNYLATIDAEQTDVTVDVTVNFPEALDDAPDYGLFDLDASGIIGRYSSSFDFLVVGIRQFSGEVGVWKYAGIWTEVVAPVAIPGGVDAGDDYQLSATFDGTMVTVAVDGLELISEDTSLITTGTQFGARAFSEGDEFDDFTVTRISGGILAIDGFGRPDSTLLGVTEELGDDLEFVEILNATDESINLTGWRLRKGVDYDFVAPGASAVSLGGGETIVVVSFDPANPLNDGLTNKFRSVHGLGNDVVLVGPFSGKLNNGGEAIELQRPDTPPLLEPEFTPHIVVDRVVYEPTAPWPDVSISFGSLNRTSIDTFGHEATSWQAAVPTPGSATLTVSAPRVVGVGAGGPVYGSSQVIDASAAGITTLDIYFNAPEFLLGPTLILDGAIQLNDNGQSGSGSLRQFQLDAAVMHRWLEVTTGGALPAESLFVGQLMGDLDGNQSVGAGDLSKLFGSATPIDITGDGITNAADLARILAMWGDALPEIPIGDPATGDAAMSDTATGDTSPKVIDAALVELSTDPSVMGPSPTFIAEPIGPQESSPLRIRRTIRPDSPDEPANRLARRRRLSRSAVDVVVEGDVFRRWR